MHYIIDSVPFFSGIAFGLAGYFQEKYLVRYRLESNLQQEKRYHELMMSLSDGVFINSFRKDGLPAPFLKVNQAACRLLGYSHEELLSLTSLDIDAPELREQLIGVARKLTIEQHGFFETIVVTKDRRRIPAEIRLSLLDLQGEPLVLSLVRDISARKEAEKQALRAQKHFQTLFQQSPLGMVLANSHGVILEVNQALCYLFGCFPKHIIGRTIMEITHPEDQEASEQMKDHLLRKEITDYQLEKRYLRSNGDFFWANLTIAGICEEEQEDPLLLGILEDITEKKQLQLHMLGQQKRLTEAEKIAGMGSWELDMVTGKMSFSEQFFSVYAITGEADKEAFYHNAQQGLEYVHPEERETWRQVISEAFSEGRDFDFQHRAVRKDGVVIHIAAGARFTSDRQGKPVHAYGTIQDITISKQKETGLTHAREQAEEAAREKQSFLSMMSHEIRTPLNAVVGIAHLLSQENPRPDQLELLQTLRFSSGNLLSLINNVLDLSKIDAGKITFEEADFALSDLIWSIVRSHRFKAGEKRIGLTAVLSPAIPPVIRGDQARLTQVLHNLISNALKFTQEGGVSVEVSLDGETDDDCILGFSVTDTGIGIPKDKQESIFDAFVQADAATTRRYGGTGLGLPITKRLLDLQKSSLHLISTPGSGSRFWFRLRFGKGQLPANSDQPGEPCQTVDLSTLRVLLADDNQINQMVASRFLQKWNITPALASDGLVALQKVMEAEYDLVLMDLQMPVMDGFEASRRIRQLGGKYLSLPIAALTADTVDDVRERALAAGITDFLTKPFSPDDLHRLVTRYARPQSRPPALTAAEPPGQTLQSNCRVSKIYKLADGDMKLVAELLSSSAESLRQLLADATTALKGRDHKRLRFTVHKSITVTSLLNLSELEHLFGKAEEMLAGPSERNSDIDQVTQSLREYGSVILQEMEEHISRQQASAEAVSSQEINPAE